MKKRAAHPQWVQQSVAGQILAAEAVSQSQWLVLTASEIALVSPEGRVWARGWHEVDRGEWEGDSHTFTITWVGEREPTTIVTEAEFPRDLPLAFRERVDASIVHTEHAPAPGGGMLRATVRRHSTDSRLLTQVSAVGQVHPGPDLDARIDALEAKVRDAVGM